MTKITRNEQLELKVALSDVLNLLQGQVDATTHPDRREALTKMINAVLARPNHIAVELEPAQQAGKPTLIVRTHSTERI